MALITIDNSKCKQDKICVMECPMQIITMKEGEFPEVSPKAESICINCGHCVAVCPTGALSLTTMKAEDCDPIDKNWNPGVNVIENYFKARRSVRRFRKDNVEREKLEKLMEITAFAPSGHNSRPVEWIIYTEREKIKSLVSLVIQWMKSMEESSPEIAKSMHFDMITKAWDFGIDVITHNCPVLAIAHGKKSNPNTAAACSIALAHMELIAPSLGLGACWGGFFTWCAMTYGPLKEALAMPEGNIIQGTMLLGYPLFKYSRIPKRSITIDWR
ncbi:MAG: hypothetical protein BWY23_00930 [Spirochaetes bacterium ADurb.Bin218]|jgi:nitroreductase/NAD-dependent dihydropyrimidine dehydrogenase PreA subunit|nr:nitroreductase family protein [Spirochaetota bacterium]OQA98815.1 MAG: hypothetical protein BWY23_00930 [Spirochaetes bacterium ADurb.Bin218]HOV09130.1 nitroreductase family protein [Spirochaetota bacterium]